MDSTTYLIVTEGQMTIGKGAEATVLEAGGFAYLPAKRIQELACTSKTGCRVDLCWDGKVPSRKPPVQ